MEERIGLTQPDFNRYKHYPLVSWLLDYFGGKTNHVVPTSDNKTSQNKIVQKFKQVPRLSKLNKKDLEVCLTYIRVNSLCPISGVGGTFLMTTNQDLDTYQRNLEERNLHNQRIITGMEAFRDTMSEPKSEIENDLFG
jgi:hypothetical protein